jgi:predicted permease
MFRKLWNRLESRIRRRNLDGEMDGEIRFHLEMQIEKNIAAGMSPAEARRVVLRDFGGTIQVREACHDTRHTWLDSVWQDIRYAVRSFRRDRVFTVTAILTLAVGIGATTSTYSIVDGTLFKPLPYERPDRIVMLMQGDARTRQLSETLGYEEVAALHRSRSLAAVASYSPFAVVVTERRGDQRAAVSAVGVSADFFAVLGVSPFAGRTFTADEGKPGSTNAVILSYGFWQRRFGGDRSVLGRSITVESDVERELSGPVTIVGIMPSHFCYPRTPVTAQPGLLFADRVDWDKPASPNSRYFLLGRLKDDVTLREAQTEADAIAARVQPTGATRGEWQIAVMPLRSQMVAYYHDTLLTILGAVLFLLLIACVNVANLMLARGRSREREFAIRSSLGAGRMRIVRQLLTESVLVALVGVGVGVLVSFWTLDLLVAQLPASMRLMSGLGVDARVLSFAALLTLAAVVIFGGVPALDASKPDLMASLKIGPRLRRFRRAGRARGLLLAVEVGLALVLLVGAGLLVNSFMRLQHIDLGFDPANVLAVSVQAPPPQYPSDQQVSLFFGRVNERIRSVPGVRSVATADVAPLSGALFGSEVMIEGRVQQERADTYRVGPGYFETLGIPLVKGRLLTRSDEQSRASAVVINEAMARKYWSATSALGRALIVWKDTPVRVVGIVGDARNDARTPPKPTVYVPYDPSYRRFRYRTLIIRTLPGHGDVKKAIKTELAALDPRLTRAPVAISDWLGSTVAAPRFYAMIYASFAGIGLLLAAVGIAGVAAHNVVRRRQEIGVRLALGGSSARVVAMIARQVLVSALVGGAFGLGAAWMLARTLASLLFDIKPGDPATFVAVAALLAAVALLATYLPARRAARVDPIEVLRAE